MYHEQQAWMRFAIACGSIMLLVAAVRSSDAGVVPGYAGGKMASVQGGRSLDGDPLSRLAHRLTKHVEHTTMRLWDVLSYAGGFWVSLFVSALVFLMVAAVSSAVDLRMLKLEHRRPRALSRHLGHGTLTFLRILRDRRTPVVARLVLVGALLYWLFPLDLIPDDTVVPGFVDDVVIAVLAAKGFVYLCPESLVARHAAAVEAHA